MREVLRRCAERYPDIERNRNLAGLLELQHQRHLVALLQRIFQIHHLRHATAFCTEELALGGRGAIDQVIEADVAGLLMLEDPVLLAVIRQTTELVAKAKIPAIYGPREYAVAGGLIAYGPDQNQLSRKAADYVDKILKGASPGSLPVEQPTKFEFVINLKAAKALGLSIPPGLLASADEVIE